MSSLAMHSEEPLLGDGGKDIATSLRYSPWTARHAKDLFDAGFLHEVYVRLVHRSLTG